MNELEFFFFLPCHFVRRAGTRATSHVKGPNDVGPRVTKKGTRAVLMITITPFCRCSDDFNQVELFFLALPPCQKGTVSGTQATSWWKGPIDVCPRVTKKCTRVFVMIISAPFVTVVMILISWNCFFSPCPLVKRAQSRGSKSTPRRKGTHGICPRVTKKYTRAVLMIIITPFVAVVMISISWNFFFSPCPLVRRAQYRVLDRFLTPPSSLLFAPYLLISCVFLDHFCRAIH